MFYDVSSALLHAYLLFYGFSIAPWWGYLVFYLFLAPRYTHTLCSTICRARTSQPANQPANQSAAVWFPPARARARCYRVNNHVPHTVLHFMVHYYDMFRLPHIFNLETIPRYICSWDFLPGCVCWQQSVFFAIFGLDRSARHVYESLRPLCRHVLLVIVYAHCFC
jgi:hypothetical protein